MDESIKRVEKLVRATNSALAQMKFSLIFDDMSEGNHGSTLRPEDLNRMFLDNFLDKGDLKPRQDEFQAGANEMFAKVEKILNSYEYEDRKNSKALDRIKEINIKKIPRKLEQSKLEGIEQSRQKLLSLIREEDFSPGSDSSKESHVKKPLLPFDRENQEKKPTEKLNVVSRNIDSIPDKNSPVKTKIELKKKILETQEIVDRGFLTARRLARKVEGMAKCDKKEKTSPSTDKTASDNNFRSLGSKTESSETVETIKCKGPSGKGKYNEKTVQKLKRINAQVIDVKRNELQRRVKSNLQFQRLPSVHIRGELKLQKVHNLEIPASESSTEKSINTAINFLSHEGMEREKMKKILEKVRKENCCCMEKVEEIRRNYVECFNCGKLIKIRKTWVDPQKVDDILYECNFNVSDPRIDEFVEKFGSIDSENLCTKNVLEKPAAQSGFTSSGSGVKSKNFSEKPETKHQAKELKENRHMTLREFSNEFFKKYRQEVETLEDKHIKIENLLQNLFRKVDESKKVFDECHFSQNLKYGSKRLQNLRATAPVLVTLKGSSFKKKNRQKNAYKAYSKKITKNDVESRAPARGVDEKKIISTSANLRSENYVAQEGPSSIICYDNKDGTVESGPKEFPRRLSGLQPHQIEKIEHPDGKERIYKKSPSAMLGNEPETRVKAKLSGMTQSTTPGPKKIMKGSDWVFSKEEKLNAITSMDKDGMTEPLKTKKEKIDTKIPSASSSVSSNKSRRICSENSKKSKVGELKTLVSTTVRSKTVKALLKREEVEKELLVISPRTAMNTDSEEAELFERTSEKSENNYESDFESLSNEPEGKDDDRRDGEPEIVPFAKKLSTISEVGSELENKISEEPRTPKSTNHKMKDEKCNVAETSVSEIMQQMKKADHLKLKEQDSVSSEIACKSKCKKISKESYKNILAALQDQFVKTESLADKLTEHVKMEGKYGDSDFTSVENLVLTPRKMPAPPMMVENLQSARKNMACTSKSSLTLFLPQKSKIIENKKSEKDLSADSLSDEGGSSLGEIIHSERRKGSSEKSEESFTSEGSYLNLNNAKNSSWLSTDPGEANVSSGLKLLS